jgi:hypothetical protein
VQSYDDRPKRRLYEVLKAQGMQNNQEVVFLTDGGEDVRELPLYLNVTAEHYLDWFHITMRITVLRQMARCLLDVAEHLEDGPVVTAAQADRELERIKWFLWHGNTFRALQVIDDLRFDLEWEEGAGPEHEAFFKKLTELDGYLNANGAWIPNYGERYRCGEAISTAFAEATINQVVSKRMVKKQQMRWSPRGAHLLLQIRTRVWTTPSPTTSAAGTPASRVPSRSRSRPRPRLRRSWLQ